MKYIIFTLVTIFAFIQCEGVQSGREDLRERDYDREADLSELDDEELEEVITDQEESIEDAFKDIFKNLENCETSTPTLPQNKLDLLFEVIGASKYNTPLQVRTCVQQRLETATEKLCVAKQQIYAEQQKCRNFDERCKRLENSMRRLDKLQSDYRKTLREGSKKFRNCRKDSNDAVQGECEAWKNIFDGESFLSCDYDNR